MRYVVSTWHTGALTPAMLFCETAEDAIAYAKDRIRTLSRAHGLFLESEKVADLGFLYLAHIDERVWVYAQERSA